MYVRRSTGQPRLSAIVPARRLSLFGHIARMPDETDARSIITAPPSENWRRPPGRPRTTWMKTIQQDLKSNNLSLDEAITVAQNRPLWRLDVCVWCYAPLVVLATQEEEFVSIFTHKDLSVIIRAQRFNVLYWRLTASPANPMYLSLAFFAFLRSSRTRSSSWTKSTSSFAFCRTVHITASTYSTGKTEIWATTVGKFKGTNRRIINPLTFTVAIWVVGYSYKTSWPG